MPRFVALLLLSLVPSLASAELKLSSIFGDSMVVQRDQPIHVWGFTKAGTQVKVSMAGHSGTATADDEGRFDVSLDALPAGGPHEMVIEADETRTFSDVLVGEVWVCSGQSNMSWQVISANDSDLESLTAKFPQIRLVTIPHQAAQSPQNSFDGKWSVCTPGTAEAFSAVGYFFGRQIHQTLDVPVGLICNSWGGSAAEAWVPNELLVKEKKYDKYLAEWEKLAETYHFEDELSQWEKKVEDWKSAGQKEAAPVKPLDLLQGPNRPGNLYNGCLNPIIGYPIAGVIWYQGEANVWRAHQYRDLFPLLIQRWRDDWKQGDFPFYWVQLADHMDETPVPTDSIWAELREAQTMTMDRLPHTGQAVITDLGEAADIHPRNKQDVAKRLARWALAKNYGYDLPYQSPTFESMEIKDSKALITFHHVGGGMDTFDVRELRGFTIAGEDRKFVVAEAKIIAKDKIEVSANSIAHPVSVRYAWADNPVANVQSTGGLPATPFRTDDWPGVTVNAGE